ncbi:MAG: RHS repeat-associated core domain-containing protein [Chthonomonas sp.]|nr:RHS repeat-associated core domain-containing protein [Chthonomonas sp.]
MLLPSIAGATDANTAQSRPPAKVSKKTFDPGHYELNTFDSRGRLSTSTLKTAGHSVMRSQSYVYDKASFVREHTVGSNTTEYTYDDAGQLIREEKPWLTWDREYEYDGNGNRKKHIHNSTEYRYIYDPGDRLKEIQESDIFNTWYPIREFTYDAAGRMLDSDGATMVWDHEGRLTSVTTGMGSSTNSYNGLNARVAKASGGTTTFTRDGVGVTSPLMRDSAGTAYTPGISYRTGADTTFHHFGLKNAEYETDSVPAVTADSSFDGFGEPLSMFSTGSMFGFGGGHGYQADDSGLLLLGERWYDPTIGRFVSKDSSHDGANWYAYCGNNPISRTDAEGKKWKIIAIAALRFIQFLGGGPDDKPFTLNGSPKRLKTERVALRTVAASGSGPKFTTPTADGTVRPLRPMRRLPIGGGGVRSSGGALGGIVAIATGAGAFAQGAGVVITARRRYGDYIDQIDDQQADGLGTKWEGCDP